MLRDSRKASSSLARERLLTLWIGFAAGPQERKEIKRGIALMRKADLSGTDQILLFRIHKQLWIVAVLIFCKGGVAVELLCVQLICTPNKLQYTQVV